MSVFIKALLFVVVAEMGDKTQLMNIAIAAQLKQPVLILMGTTVGMLVADAIGILGGSWLAKHVPETYIKWGAAAIFLLLGAAKLYDAVPKFYISAVFIVPFFVVLAGLIYIIGFRKIPSKNTVGYEPAE